MGNIFSKFFMSFSGKKNKCLPAGKTDEVGTVASIPTNIGSSCSTVCKTAKTLASFDLIIEKPKYVGAIPEATIKFYPLD